MEFDIGKAFNILIGKLETWLEALIGMLPNFVVAAMVMVAFYFIARIVRHTAGKLLGRVSDKPAINHLFTTLIYLLALCIGLIVALNILHLEQTVTSILAGAGILGLALGFAFQDISANFISGVILAFRKPIKVGDIVDSGGHMGIVEKIDLRVTIIKTFQGLHVIIPNKDVLQNPITNFTKTSERRIDLEVGVSYGDDLEKVKEIAVNAVSKLSFLLDDKDVNLFYTGFGDSSINFVIQLWIHYPGEPGYLKARSDAIMAIKKAFDENKISIPFPIRTLDFGIKGGEKLSQISVQHNGAAARNSVS